MKRNFIREVARSGIFLNNRQKVQIYDKMALLRVVRVATFLNKNKKSEKLLTKSPKIQGDSNLRVVCGELKNNSRRFSAYNLRGAGEYG